MIDKKILEFYKRTSPYTELGLYADFAKNLPDDISELCLLQRNQIIHPIAFKKEKIRNSKNSFWGDMTQISDMNLLREDDIFPNSLSMLAELLRKDSTYSLNREAKDKIFVTCRGQALLLAAILFATGSPVCFAANDNNKSDNKAKKECQKGKKCEGQRCEYNPFEGLNLTENQQAKLNDLKSEFCKKQENRKNGEGQKMDKNKKDDQQRPDRRQAKREYLAKVKSILTPDQYVTFLENMAVNRPDMGHVRPHEMRKGHKDMMKMKQGRPEKAQAKKQKDSSK